MKIVLFVLCQLSISCIYAQNIDYSKKSLNDSVTLKPLTYPNPVENTIHFSITDQVFNYTIYDMMGNKITSGSTQSQIEVSKLPMGVYILLLHAKEEQWTYRFVKK